MSTQADVAAAELDLDGHGYTDRSVALITPTSQEVNAVTSSNLVMAQQQKSSTATGKILAAYREYRERRYPQTVAFYEKMESLPPSNKGPSDAIISADNMLHTNDNPTTTTSFRTGTTKSPALKQRDSPRYDRAGNLRPPNKRFMQRDSSTGRLISPEPGLKNYTQLDEIRDWIKEKHYTKFDMIPDASKFIFEDMDPEYITEPSHLRNRGRKLRVGKFGTTEIWAVLPVSTRLYMPRLLQRDVVGGHFTPITKTKDQRDVVMPELDYPFGAFRSIGNKLPTDWAALNAVIAYVYLLCREADVVFSDSSKWPGQLSTALSRIKQVYAPNDPHPTAAIVKTKLAGVPHDDEEELTTETGGDTELATIKEVLRRKGLLSKMEAMVSVPAIFTFKDLKVLVKAKNIQNIRNRALFLGGNEQVETWAMLYQDPNKAQLSVIVNVDKAKGGQTLVQFFPDIQWSLAFPFEAFRQKGDQLSFRKMQYVIGYVFLSCREAEKALNLTDAIFKHLVNITKTVNNHYGSVHPPRTSVDITERDSPFAQSTEVCTRDNLPIPPPVMINGSKREGKEDLVIEDTAITPVPITPKTTELQRNPDSPIPAPDRKHLRPACRMENSPTTYPTKVMEDRSVASSTGHHPTYTAHVGEYRSLDDLHVSLFLESNVRHGKRRLSDQEDRATKYIRVESQRIEVKKLRTYQETVTGHAKRAMEEAQRLYEQEKQKTRLLQEYELNLAILQGDISRQMADEDILSLPDMRGD